MAPCRQPICQFCSPSEVVTAIRRRHPQQQLEPVVRFSAAQKHRFVSGYEAILNCPTVNLMAILVLSVLHG